MNHVPPIPAPEVRARHRRITLPWRLAFVVYAIALTTGTHWPRLELPQTVPATDKTIHLLAFGGLTFLLWQTRWVRHLWAIGVIVLCWAALDEFTQGLPGLNRTVTAHDFVANSLGVVVTVAWIWAMRTRGERGGMNRWRMARFNFIVEEMFADRRAWLACVIGAIATVVPLLVYWFGVRPGDEAVRVAIIIAAIGSMIVTYLGWMRLWRVKSTQAMRDTPCVSCGAATLKSETTSEGKISCGVCKSEQSTLIWAPSREPNSRVLFRMALKPALIGVACLVAGFALILITPVVHGYFIGQGGSGARIAPRIASTLGTLPRELENAIDLAAYLLLFAVVTRMYRGSLARFHDRPTICMQCGHDLRGTPVDANGVGRCGECGTAFARLHKSVGNTENTDAKPS